MRSGPTCASSTASSTSTRRRCRSEPSSRVTERRGPPGIVAGVQVLPPGLRRLAREAAVIVGLVALGAFLVYHFTVHTIRNTRPLGGSNVEVAREAGDQTEPAFAVDPARPSVLAGALEALEVYSSADGGRRRRPDAAPAPPSGPGATGPP